MKMYTVVYFFSGHSVEWLGYRVVKKLNYDDMLSPGA